MDTPGGKFRILVADDTRYWRQKITDVLERSGHEVIAVENGRSAIRFCMNSERHVDLVVVDLVMPGMDGFEVARVLRSLPNASRQRIIGVTDVIRPEDSNMPSGALSDALVSLSFTQKTRTEVRIAGPPGGVKLRVTAFPTATGVGVLRYAPLEDRFTMTQLPPRRSRVRKTAGIFVGILGRGRRSMWSVCRYLFKRKRI